MVNPEGANPAMVPPSKSAMEFGPLLEEERIMRAVKIFRNLRFLTPLSMLAMDFGPLFRNATLESLKWSMTKKVLKTFSVIDDFLGRHVLEKMSKKCHSKITSKIWPPFLKLWIC